MTSTNNDWVFYASDLSAIPGVNNNPNFAFRIVSEWESTAIGDNNSDYAGTVTSLGTSGTMRSNLVSVYGDPGVRPALGSTTISNIIHTALTYGGGAGSEFILLKSVNPAAPFSGPGWAPTSPRPGPSPFRRVRSPPPSIASRASNLRLGAPARPPSRVATRKPHRPAIKVTARS